MLISRAIDRRAAIYIRQGKAWFNISSAGHEALGVMGYNLKSDDLIFPHYRDKSLLLVRGVEVADFARDLMAKATSESNGRNMSAHFSCREKNVFSIASPTASQCLPAAGAAWGMKLKNSSDIVLCCIGDAAIREGEFYEAVCFAVEKNLPIIFVIADNKYGVSTSTLLSMPFRLGIFSTNIFTKIDGYDVDEVYNVSREIILKTRAGMGPAILWCELDRLDSHTNHDDQSVYRNASELQNLKDPIDLFADELIQNRMLAGQNLPDLKDRVACEVDEIFSQVSLEISPDHDEIAKHLYNEVPSGDFFAITDIQIENCKIDIVKAIKKVLQYALGKDNSVLLFGEDIEDPKGGVFNLTKGLSGQFLSRVFNAPLAEATIIGAAVGLAATGYKPIVEIQYIDFIAPAFNQLASQVATLRWRTAGHWQCPLIIYAPYGGYLPGGGIWHSQANEGIFAHIPGLKIAIPCEPLDVLSIFCDALNAADPTLILIPKHIMWKAREVDLHVDVISKKAKIIHTGSDVSIVTWGNCVELVEKCADDLSRKGISVEVIVLLMIEPCDWHSIFASLRKTGRLVVVHEDNSSCGFGANIISRVLTDKNNFYNLYSSPKLVAKSDIYIPFNPELEYCVLPSVNDVVVAVRSVINE